MLSNEYDKEVIKLCEALNNIPNVRTTESCCGHGKNYFRIFFIVEDIETLNLLMWAGCNRWWSWANCFDVIVYSGDPNRDSKSISLILESFYKGEDAYNDAESMAKGINKFIKEWINKDLLKRRV